MSNNNYDFQTLTLINAEIESGFKSQELVSRIDTLAQFLSYTSDKFVMLRRPMQSLTNKIVQCRLQ